MFYAVLFLAMQSVVAWRVFQNGERITEAINLLGDIKMKQADFEKEVDGLYERMDVVDAKTETESGEIKEVVTGLRDEIARLLATQGDDIDTSRLEGLKQRLESSAERISGLIDDPSPTTDPTPPIGEPAPQNPVDTVDPIEPTQQLPAETTSEVPATEATEASDANAEKVEG